MRSLEIHDGPTTRAVLAIGRAAGNGVSRPPARRVAARPVRRAVPRVAGVRGTRGGHGGGRVTRYGPAAPPQPPVITKTTKHMNTTLITLNAQFGRRTNTLSRGPGDRRRNPPSSRRAERIACPPKLKAAKPNSLCLLPPPASSWPHRSCWSIASPSVSLNRGPDQASR